MSILIETERILLRKYTVEDCESVFQLDSDKRVQKYTGDLLIRTKEQALEIITQKILRDYEQYGYGRWAAVFKPEKKVIGFAGLKFLPEIEETDIGFRFMPEYWGMGLASESAKAIIDYGFTQLDLEKIIGIAMPDNKASCRVLEKIGLKYYKTDGYNGDRGQYYWYRIDREEYSPK